MFIFFGIVAVCATIVFLAFRQPTFKIEITHKQAPVYEPDIKPIGGFKVDETKDVDELADMLGDITDLFTGGDRINEETAG